MDSDGAVANATAFVSAQLRAAGEVRLNVTDPVLHAGAGTPSATITGPHGSLDLRVDRLTGASSVHLVTPGFPQHGTSDPIDTQLGVNLGATVINVPDADLLAVVERAVPILYKAQRDLDGDTARVQGTALSAMSATSPLAVDAVAHHTTGGDPSLVRSASRADQKMARAPGVGDVRATCEAGGAAVTDALARLQAGSPARSRHDDYPHRAPGGPSIR